MVAMVSRSRTEPTPDLFAASAKLSSIRPALPVADINPTEKPDYLLPKDLQGALTRLPDAEIDTLLMAVTKEAKRRGRLPRPPDAEHQINRDVPVTKAKPLRAALATAGDGPLAVGKANAVKAAFMAGVKPSTIARQFGISQSAVKQVLAQIRRGRKP